MHRVVFYLLLTSMIIINHKTNSSIVYLRTSADIPVGEDSYTYETLRKISPLYYSNKHHQTSKRIYFLTCHGVNPLQNTVYDALRPYGQRIRLAGL